MSWYYAENNQRLGPVDESAFQSLVAQGRITQDTLVWREGMANWLPYSEVAAAPPPVAAASAAPGNGNSMATAVVSAPSANCVECGRPFPLEEMVSYEGRFVCPQCKPIFFQRVKEGAIVPGQRVYAGFWIRFLAVFIDGIIVQIIAFICGMILGIVGGATGANEALANALGFLLGLAYEVYFIGSSGATPGKMALKLRVVRADGTPVGYGLATGRYFAKILSAVILLIGYIMAAFDDQRRALHDRICDTRVVRE